MKEGLLANLGRALAACVPSALAASAQEAPAPPRPAPDRLVVQVFYKKGAKPSYLDVPGTAWYAHFGSSDTAAPTVDNRTQSVAAAVTAFTPDPLPRAKLTLTNLSPKRVRAIELRMVFGGRPRTSMLHRVRTELLKDLARFQQKFQAAPADNSFQGWLAEQQARDEGWLARL